MIDSIILYRTKGVNPIFCMKDINKLMHRSDTAKEINPPRIKIDQSIVSSDWIASIELPNKTADNVGIDKRKENLAASSLL